MFKNGQTYFQNCTLFTPQDFKSMFKNFSTSWKKRLIAWQKQQQEAKEAILADLREH